MHELKTAFRSLRSAPAVTLAVIGTLALAIGANTAIFSVVRGALLESIGYPDSERVVVLWAQNESDPAGSYRLSPADYRDVRDEIAGFDGKAALYRSQGSTLSGLEPPQRIGSYNVTPRLFEVLGTRAQLGRLFTRDDEVPGGPAVAVMSDAAWRTRFAADPELVGQTIEIDGAPRTVIGIAEPGFTFPPGNEEVGLYFPMALSDAILLDRDHRMFDGLALLDEGTSLERVNGQLEALAASLEAEFGATNQGWSLVARPLRDELLGGMAPTIWLLMAAVAVVLVVASVNIANILVARSLAARREFALRAALGADRGSLFWRSAAESLLLGFFGLLGATLVAIAGLRLLGAALPREIARLTQLSFDWKLAAFTAFLTLGAVLIFGALPAFRSTSPRLRSLVDASAGSGAGRNSHRVRELGVFVQVVLATVLVAGGARLLWNLDQLGAVDPGIRDRGVVSMAVQLPSSRYDRQQWPETFDRIVERMRTLPGVTAAGATSDLPMSDVGLGFELEFEAPGLDSRSGVKRPNADVRMITDGLLDALGIELVAGRDFEPADRTAEQVRILINQTLADRVFGATPPVGRSLDLDLLGEVEIIGVVGNVRHEGLQSRHESEIYVTYGRPATAEMHIVATSDGDEDQLMRAMGEALREIDPELVPSSIESVRRLLWQSIERPRFAARLVGLLALSAALMAALGVYGVVTTSVIRRTTEFGVRAAMGAGPWQTVVRAVRRPVGLGVVGAVCGLAIVARLSPFLGRVVDTPVGGGGVVALWTLLGVCTTVALVALGPALRVLRISPTTALRHE